MLPIIGDVDLKHVVLRSDLKQFVKKGGYHIQHVNELHNRLKKWIDGTFWGVAKKICKITSIGFICGKS